MIKNLFIVLASVFAIASCGTSKTGANKKAIAYAQLNSTADPNQKIGDVSFYAQPDGRIKKVMTINMKEKANSSVAVHFHEHGDCGNKGDNTHGHWNPTKENHGQWGVPPFHSGDIGNINLNSAGKGTVTLVSDRWSVDAQSPNNIVGRGIIVHSGIDDYKTQPTGNSGPRAGCGVIVKP